MILLRLIRKFNLLNLICFSILFMTVGLKVSALPNVVLGADLISDLEKGELKGKRVILFSNSTGRNSQGVFTAEILSKSENIKLIYILTPEHGFFANAQAGSSVNNSKLFGIPVISLYGKINKPGKSQLSECDAIIIDIQDIGVRSYTYISTTFKILQAASQFNKPVYILDRPNPIGGNVVDGNVLEKGMESFVGIAPIAYIHGMTIGELAQMINNEGWLNDETNSYSHCDIKIIKMKNYTRSMTWEECGLMWYPTSPNVPTVNSVRALAMTGIFGELGLISIGIGTTTPFQNIGFENFDYSNFKKNLKQEFFDGIVISENIFLPQFGMNEGKNLNGIYINFSKSTNFKPFTAGIELILAIRKSNPELFKPEKIKPNSKSMFNKVTGTVNLFNALFNSVGDDNVFQIAGAGIEEFIKLRSKYLIY